MKKKMAMTVMALAVSAMAGSAFAANEPAKTTGSSAPLKMVTKDGTDALQKPIFNLEQMAKEKGITVEELIKQLEKEGKLTKATASSNPDGTNSGLAVIALDPENKDGGAFITLAPAMNLEEMAKEKGISVEELIEQLKEEGKLATNVSMTTINLEEVAKEKGISVEKLLKQLEKEGTIATGKAASFTHPAISLEQMAKEKGISVEELIKQFEKEGKITKGTTISVPAIKK
ncbi:hypothetical protein [Brevibacillus porteri]|uniref:Uncharacterized protein n=1 Tax=Brevibacillus porteri TaxID=2126350 RepID=A0ABX5FRH4_9BACL|nr:hypothetical protein [Brevibacillus porteri]MED1800443.1 hypothetical protein [Brevibacillus porteri]MED2133976.1 hypothetical protein [Brevibacillus porteri]MED2743146.1 hypothetical protein [Brevibacillus porteri]MED2812821.1 hypothetical protein [Brevibacillus porteri]MED2893386.1 hypothetical protein [Brevibacillus porteri]